MWHCFWLWVYWNAPTIQVAAAVVQMVVTIIGVPLLLLTLRANSRAAKAAADSAEAALKSAEILVNSERPWLLVEWEGDLIQGFSFWLRNAGKTPAKVIWLDPLITGQLIAIGSTLPEPPRYGYGFAEGGQLVNARWIAPGGRDQIGLFDSFGVYGKFDGSSTHFEAGLNRLFLYGAIKYADTLTDREHRTHFCYRLGNYQLFLDGPPGYNELT